MRTAVFWVSNSSAGLAHTSAGLSHSSAELARSSAQKMPFLLHNLHCPMFFFISSFYGGYYKRVKSASSVITQLAKKCLRTLQRRVQVQYIPNFCLILLIRLIFTDTSVTLSYPCQLQFLMAVNFRRYVRPRYFLLVRENSTKIFLVFTNFSSA